MPQYTDCYFLVENRERSIVESFIARFLPFNKQAAEDYPIPLYADNPKMIFKDLNDILLYLEKHTDLDYSIYWKNCDEKSLIKHFMVFYTDDGKIIFGISTIGSDPAEKKVVLLFNQILDFLLSKVGCITVEEPPPFNSLEFIKFSKDRYIPNR